MSVLSQLSQELEALVRRTAPAVVGVEHRQGQGSGMVLAQDGYVLTNAHVVRGFRDLRVDFSSGAKLKGHLVGADDRTDLAVVRVEGDKLACLALAERSSVQVGQLVMAIGNPWRFERSVSLGVVSALDRSLPARGGHLFEGLVQTDAAINPGNSGGPLVNTEGAVVGVNTAMVPYAQGIGFAVPSHTVSWVAAVLLRKGEVQRPFLGIAGRGEELDVDASQRAGQPRAVRVVRVGTGTPAAHGGLKDGDLLLTANGNYLASIDDLQRVMVLGEQPSVELAVLRDTQRHAVSVRPGAPQTEGGRMVN